MKLFIKNMVSLRCKMIVKSELQKLGISFTSVGIGEANINVPVSPDQFLVLKENLSTSGLELLENPKTCLIEKIKGVIVEMIHFSEASTMLKTSDYISKKMQYNYTYLNNAFVSFQGVPISHFIIQHKIERIKELLTYNELNVSEIADLMHYKSVAHLSAQFKKFTGVTTRHFKNMQFEKRRCLEDI